MPLINIIFIALGKRFFGADSRNRQYWRDPYSYSYTPSWGSAAGIGQFQSLVFSAYSVFQQCVFEKDGICDGEVGVRGRRGDTVLVIISLR